MSETWEYGVSYHVGLDGRPVQAFVESADDWLDASAWLDASGDPDARIVRRPRAGGDWEVAR